MAVTTGAIVGSAGLSLVGGLLGADAQADAQEDALNAERARLAQLRPFLDQGLSALPEFRDNIGKAPSYADVIANLKNDPGYQFELGQGSDQVEGSAAAQGLLRSGRTLKGLTQYAQGLASTRGGEAYNREVGAFGNKQQQLLSLIQGGMNAGGAQSAIPQLLLQGGQNTANMYTGIANTGTNLLGNLLTANQLQSQPASPGVNWNTVDLSLPWQQ